ncbi:MAG: hypothetical protein GY938_02725 [Ketobacter sp.]|nr:hypothetical protein [Ketobacter sp.]
MPMDEIVGVTVVILAASYR